MVQERYRSNAIALEDIEQIDTITKESVVKPFEEIPGPPPLSLLGTIVQRLPGGMCSSTNVTIKFFCDKM